MFNVLCKLCKEQITEEKQFKSSKASFVSVGKMIDDKQMWYGLSGVFSVIKPLGLVKGDSICMDCMILNKEAFVPSLTTQCSCCKEYYQPIDSESSMAWSCCSKVYMKDERLKLSCGFGSKYDCTVFDAVAVVKVGDEVCDNCIERFIFEEMLTEDVEASGF
jgi:hypothetical protein